MTDVAKEYGLSDRGLAKLCERNGIPVPPRGYWAKKKAGYKVIKPPLIVLDYQKTDTVLLLSKAADKKQDNEETYKEQALPDEVQEAIKQESLPKHHIKVPKTLTNPHPIVDKWYKEEERDSELYRKYGGWHKPNVVNSLERRRRRIISALLNALEARGFKVELDREYGQFIWVRHNWDRIGFSVNEHMHQYRRQLTEDEKQNRSNQKWTQVSDPTDLLNLRISSEYRRSYDAKDFRETAENPLENQLNEVMIGFIEKIWTIKKQRLKREEEEDLRRKRYLEEENRKKLLKEEQERKNELETKAAQWKKAHDIRKYVDAVSKAFIENKLDGMDKDKLEDWKRWALTHAINIDPIASGNPLVELVPSEEEIQ